MESFDHNSHYIEQQHSSVYIKMLLSCMYLKYIAIIPSVDHKHSFKQTFEETLPFTSNLKPHTSTNLTNRSHFNQYEARTCVMYHHLGIHRQRGCHATTGG
jgi:hypothetical protein